MLSTAVLITFVFFLSSYLYKRRFFREDNPSGLPHPPGPKPWPIVGSYFQLSAKVPQWLLYSEWGKQYGDLIYLRVLTEDVIVINSERIANDLLEKRSGIYSDRPVFRMMRLLGLDFNMAFVAYGTNWRDHRRMFQQVFRADNLKQYFPVTIGEARNFLRRLMEYPDDFMAHVKHYSVSNILRVVYGYQIADKDDHYVKIANQTAHFMSENSFPGDALLDYFPALLYFPSWFPGMGFKANAELCRNLLDEMQDFPLDFVKSNMGSAGPAAASVAAELLNRTSSRDGGDSQSHVLRHVAGTGYFAGADTTISVLNTFFLAMVLYPDAQKAAHKEIDTVLGSGRLPDFDNRKELPYVEAIYRETLRWRPALPLSVSHATTEADVYNGYFIPKGATIIMNTWAMHMDPRVYQDPWTFKPERYLDSDGSIKSDYPLTNFGMGRRICPGRHAADAAVWAAIASVLTAFEITKAKDDNGNEIEVRGEYSNGLVSHTLPFKCKITPRSPEVGGLIMESGTSSA